jgi:23S rRNA pseudouridine2605 synthase
VNYKSIDAGVERVQGSNVWLTMALREGKNREIKRVLEALDLKVNRLIRLSFGPFQLGQLESGKVEEVPRRVLRQQLGKNWQTIIDGTVRGGREDIAETETAKPAGRASKPRGDKPRSDKPRSDKPRGGRPGGDKPSGKSSGKSFKSQSAKGPNNARGRR